MKGTTKMKKKIETVVKTDEELYPGMYAIYHKKDKSFLKSVDKSRTGRYILKRSVHQMMTFRTPKEATAAYNEFGCTKGYFVVEVKPEVVAYY